MRIESLLGLIDGTLANRPKVASFERIQTDPSKVRRGDLFLAFEKEGLDLAVRNGAYVVVFDKPIEITDDEIAWVKVDSLAMAALKLARYQLAKNPAPLYLIDDVEYQLAKKLSSSKNILFLSEDITACLEDIFLYDDKSKAMILCNDSSLLKKLALPFERPAENPGAVTVYEQTLFETSFYFQGRYYERCPIPPLFIDRLERMLGLFCRYNLEISLNHLDFTSHFKPIFVDTAFGVKEFGKSERVLIFEPDCDLFAKELEFLKRNAAWAKKIYLACSEKKGFFGYNGIEYFSSFVDIQRILSSQNFHFALIAGADESVLKNLLFERKARQATLF